MRSFKYIIAIVLLSLISNDALAQRKKEKNKITPESGAQKQAKAKDEKLAAYEAGKKHHVETQDKATRKRMKKNLKKAEKHSWGKDVPWYKRWFHKNKKSRNGQ